MLKKCLMKRCLIFWLVWPVAFSLAAGDSHSDHEEFAHQAKKMAETALKEEKAYEILKTLALPGGRLTGSPAAARAVSRATDLMTKLGFDLVKQEPVKVNRWQRGQTEKALVKSKKGGQHRLNICALGNSIGTPRSGLEAEVLEVHSFEELEELKQAINGKIVFFNVPMDRAEPNPFAAYGRAVPYRTNGASAAARYGAVAVLVRSMTFRLDDYPHTGLMIYDENIPKIPAAAVATNHADQLSLWLKEDPHLKLSLMMNCGQLPPVISANVLGQLTGEERPEEIILLAGHLDSWDLSPGANDDAAGCVVAIEALRLIKEAGWRPKRTIRAVLFMDEEFGGTGGRFYATSASRKSEKHLLAIEQDNGGGAPVGLALRGGDKIIEKAEKLKEILSPFGINWIRPGGGGVDISPLIQEGTLAGSVIPETQRYFDFHHSALDQPTTVHPREIELQAIVLAIVSYYFSQEGI
ncbi:MAG TPA: M20/M25/M40 family metallo-hydrolase [Candidatus Saccharicenans sp.]|nr:M20/M25/M40 family metallo-hydrolase [Candidatus Saccharicenans sp.]HQO75096.1 M20/M25/M40 family metallo-hydrolase [Candidatus Saccharicenans sp.]HUM78999.1 M20/M25/M40 family metallo-hydrolase [Candidatus Saccharicenans sp.]